MATQPDLTEEQRANLATLAAYLRTLPEDYRDFDMQVFSNDEGYNAHVVSCGTAACAAGHGPAAGVLPLHNENWHAYARRAFTGHDSFGPEPDAYDWCFSAAWYYSDNTPHGAAERIDWMLAKGIPDDYYQQLMGRAPLCYRADQLAMEAF